MSILNKIASRIDRLNEGVGVAVSWLTTVLVLVVCYDVFTRYLLKKSSIAVQELEWHLFAIIFLLGAAYTLKHDRHVRVDVLYVKFSDKIKACLNLVGSLIFLIPFSILVVLTSKNFVISSFRIGETSPDPGGLPARFILKACIPIAFILVVLQGISWVIKAVVGIKKTRTTENTE